MSSRGTKRSRLFPLSQRATLLSSRAQRGDLASICHREERGDLSFLSFPLERSPILSSRAQRGDLGFLRRTKQKRRDCFVPRNDRIDLQ